MIALGRSLRSRHKRERRTVGRNVLRVTVSGDERAAIIGTNDGRLQFWHLPSLQLCREVPAHEDYVTSLAVSPDGRSVLVAGGKVPSGWDMAEEVKRFDVAVPAARKFAKTALYSPDGSVGAAGGADTTG